MYHRWCTHIHAGKHILTKKIFLKKLLVDVFCAVMMSLIKVLKVNNCQPILFGTSVRINLAACHDVLFVVRSLNYLEYILIYYNYFCILNNNYFRSTGYSEVIVVVGGCERVGGFNLPYTECYDPVTGEWKSLAKLPEFTKSEYAVCALRNDILVSGKYLLQ